MTEHIAMISYDMEFRSIAISNSNVDKISTEPILEHHSLEQRWLIFETRPGVNCLVAVDNLAYDGLIKIGTAQECHTGLASQILCNLIETSKGKSCGAFYDHIFVVGE